MAFLCSLAQAQTTTTFTGTIKDLTNTVVTSGNVTFTLQPGADTTISGNARFTPQTVTCGINASGLVKANDLTNPCVVTNNTAQQPAGTSYKVQICPAFACTASVVTYALGGSVDITTLVPTPAQMPAYSLVDIFSNQSIGGNKIFTGTVAFPGGATFAGSAVFSGSAIFKTLNGSPYVSQYCFGSTDLGVCINNAVATFAVPQRLYVDTLAPSTISTSPNVPPGWQIRFSPGPYTLSTTFQINHHGTVWDFSGAQFNCTIDNGSQCILLGKNLTGSATSNGTTTVTWNSGSQFSNFDTGDQFFFNGSAYNVSSATATTLTLTASVPSCSNCAYGSYMVIGTGLGTYFNSVVVRDLTINYTGAGTQNNIGFQLDFVSHAYVQNIEIANFLNGTCWKAVGALLTQVINPNIDVCKFGLILDQATRGGNSVTSNQNVFYSASFNGNCPLSAAGSALLIRNNSFGNTFPNIDMEGNVCTNVVVIDSGSFKNTIGPGGDIERNGDGTSSATDITLLAPSNSVIGIRFSSSAANFPNSGIVASTGATGTIIRDNYWTAGAAYTTAWNFVNGATGVAENNSPAGFGAANQTSLQDMGGNFAMQSLNFATQCWGASAFHAGLPNGTCAFPNATNLYWASAANNAIVPVINLNSSNQVQIDPNGQGTVTGGSFKIGGSGSVINDSRELVQSAHSCGTTTACANTINGSNKMIFGSVALASGTPSSATITGISPAFSSTSSYFCVVTNATTQANSLKAANVSSSSFTITGPNTVTDTVNYQCVGN